MTKSIQLLLACFLAIGILVFSGCDGTHDTSDTSGSPDLSGLSSVSFTVIWPDDAQDGNQDNEGSNVEILTGAASETMSDDCTSRGVSQVTVAVKNSSGTTLKSATFTCSAKSGTLSGITPQSNCTIVVSGKNSGGDVIYQGQKTGVTLSAGANNAGTIHMTYVGDCSYSISPSTYSYEDEGGTGTVTVDASNNSCNREASSNDTWISITSGTSGTGDGTVGYSVSSNTSSSDRTGTMTIAGETFTVSQDGADTPRITFDSLPDTGQTESYTDTFGEDSDYTINPQSYTKLDDTGTALNDNAASWAIVKDNVTGLIWQKATASERNWDSAVTYCENLTLGGYSDWRLPTVMELSTLVNSGTYNPAIDADFFPNTMSSFFSWSSTTNANYTGDAWYVVFNYGYVDYDLKSYTNYVRAVRGGL